MKVRYMASVTVPYIAFTFSWASKKNNQPLKCQTKNAADDTLCFYLYLLKKIRLDILCESSALQRIHMKYQVLFSLMNNEEIFMNIVCCSCDWGFKG